MRRLGNISSSLILLFVIVLNFAFYRSPVYAELSPVIRNPILTEEEYKRQQLEDQKRQQQDQQSTSGVQQGGASSPANSGQGGSTAQQNIPQGTPWSQRSVSDLGGSNIASQQEAKPGYLIVCHGALPEGATSTPADYDECDFGDLIELIQKAINFTIVMALSFSVILFMYAGFMYMLSTDKVDRTTQAKKIIKTTMIGLLVVICAWIAINTLVQVLGLKDKFNSLQGISSSGSVQSSPQQLSQSNTSSQRGTSGTQTNTSNSGGSTSASSGSQNGTSSAQSQNSTSTRSSNSATTSTSTLSQPPKYCFSYSIISFADSSVVPGEQCYQEEYAQSRCESEAMVCRLSSFRGNCIADARCKEVDASGKSRYDCVQPRGTRCVLSK